MPSKWFFTSNALSRDSIQLASLVPNIRYPHQDALVALALDHKLDYHVHIQQDFTGLLTATQKTLFQAHLTKLLGASATVSANHSLQLSSYEGRVYELKSPETCFEMLCRLPRVRTWLQKQIEAGRKICFVIGYRTFFDARIWQLQDRSSKVSGHIEVPVTEIVSSGVGAVAGGASDVGGGAQHSMSEVGREALHTPGEQIYAFCYRKVGFKWFGPKAVDDAFLKADNCWVMTSGNRDDEDDDGDAVEANLEELQEDDIGYDEKLSDKFITDNGEEEYILLNYS